MARLRQSGMPDEEYWESLFDVPAILDSFKINSSFRDVVELGCGYGTFSIPVARRISGVLRTCDIDPEMVKRTLKRAVAYGIQNIASQVRDVATDGFPANSNDACLLFNILHGEEPVKLLQRARDAVRVGGSIFVIHWRTDIETPRGPTLDIRPTPQMISEWAEQAGNLTKTHDAVNLLPWHYGMTFTRINGP